tara:strand:- start:63 stop:203 length:141 start_codon:yes stop_codon:yes gene_type:complete
MSKIPGMMRPKSKDEEEFDAYQAQGQENEANQPEQRNAEQRFRDEF